MHRDYVAVRGYEHPEKSWGDISAIYYVTSLRDAALLARH